MASVVKHMARPDLWQRAEDVDEQEVEGKSEHRDRVTSLLTGTVCGLTVNDELTIGRGRV